jgi:Xaa-Pro aminopeptidase
MLSPQSDEEMPYYSAASALAASTDLQRSVLMNQRNSEVAERQRELLVQRAQKNAAELRAMKRSVSMNQRNSAVSERQREMLVQRVQKNRALIRAMNRTMQFFKHKSDQSEALLSRLAGGAELEVVPQPQTGTFVFNLLESDVKLDEEQNESDMDMSMEEEDSTFGVQVEGVRCSLFEHFNLFFVLFCE